MAQQATWKRRVTEWRASGLTAAEFAAGRDFAPATLSWWAWRLGSGAQPERERGDGPRAATFVRVVAARPAPSMSREESAVVVELGEARVRVAPGVDRALLETVVSVLAAHAREGA